MIIRIFSDLPKFKNLEFHAGLNVVLAEKSADATDKQTRNRAGKSSLLDVLHFLLGSSCRPDSIFRKPALIEHKFGMKLLLGGAPTVVERIGSKPSPLVVNGDTSTWPIVQVINGGTTRISNDNWQQVLAKLMFGLDGVESSGGPSFRSLISYFIRRDREGGMAEPMAQTDKQQLCDQQVNISFLLGLDWSVPLDWQDVREGEKRLKALKNALKEGALGSVIASASSLKSDLIVAQDRAAKLRNAAATFQVVERYHDLEREASRITGRLAEFADENVVDQRYIAEIEAASALEAPPTREDLDRLYREAGVLLPQIVKRRFADVAVFHESIVKNRRSYLASERSAAERRIAERNMEQGRLDSRRSEIMRVLSSAGALEHFVALQGEFARAEAAVESLKSRHQAAEDLESGGLRLSVERTNLQERLRRDYSEQNDVISDAVLAFREISSQLYEDDKAGNLDIRPTENGPMFDPHIPGEKSKGVNNMRIFCFDMMLMMLSLKRGRSPGFLVHDSHLFDGVDERQVGKALAVGAALAERLKFQYIVTMNTDALPKEIPEGFKLDRYVLPVRLTDASEDGGLFGSRFD